MASSIEASDITSTEDSQFVQNFSGLASKSDSMAFGDISFAALASDLDKVFSEESIAQIKANLAK